MHHPTIFYNCFDKTAINEIGLKSLLLMRRRLTFGMDITIADFQIAGWLTSLMDALNIVIIGYDRVIA